MSAHYDLPFSRASDAVSEACAWLQNALEIGGGEHDCLEDCQQAALDWLDKAIAALEDSAYETFDTGECDPVWHMPIPERCVIDPQAAAALHTVERMQARVRLIQGSAEIAGVIDTIGTYFVRHHAERITAEKLLADSVDLDSPY